MTYAQGPGTIVGLTAGEQYVPQGTTLTQALHDAAVTAGFKGWYLDPRYIYTAVGPIALATGFTIRSDMNYGLGYNSLASPGTPGAYVSFTNSTGDGFQLYNQTAGLPAGGNAIQLINLNVLGNTTGTLVHIGGGARKCLVSGCYVWNANTTAGSYALILDTALSGTAANAEDNMVFNSAFFGGYAAIGIGIADNVQKPNNNTFFEVQTGGGTYGVNHTEGNGIVWWNWYDRSNEPTASYYNHGAIVTFIGGEAQNGAGLIYSQDAAACNCRVYSVNWTVVVAGVGTGTGLSVTNGTFYFSSGVANTSTVLTQASPAQVFQDVGFNGNNLTVSGTGMYYIAQPALFGIPTFSSWTGTTINAGYPVVVASLAAKAVSSTPTLTYTPPSVVATYRVTFVCKVTTAGTSTIPSIGWTDEGNAAQALGCAMTKITAAGAITSVGSMVATGYYYGDFTFTVNNSGTNIVLALTIVGSTINYTITLERIL